MTTQADMFHNVCGTLEAKRYPNVPASKQGAPETSHAAAIAARPSAGTLRGAVIKVLRTGSYTADEIARQLGESILSIRPRCSELVALARVVDSGLRRRNDSGRMAVVLRLA